ncbi:sulfotransferase [Sphingomonas jatrophae]|uniref:Sulfotransferase family protein n=1 Tax=Sphingomonas jatrophae TaxID=1166337 RepID=A0A1I6L717_9SPHN|nr:sulfotransferase [Sphingomonas jatrophae]SFR99028.1 Sulfotransferase family protein [Sphingomonas jatrophae]
MSALGPDFVCIGPKRSATTWLADQLKLHRDIWLPPIQELGYLDGGFAQHRGKAYLAMRWTPWEIAKRVIRNKGPGIGADRAFLRTARALVEAPGFDAQGYAALFAPAGRRLSGDISPMYASMTVAEIERAAPVLAQARVLLLARDPVQRFWSELAMHARKRSFGAVDYGSLAVARSFFDEPARRRQHLLSDITARWREGIGAERLGILFFDDIVADPAGSLRRIVAEIGADWCKRLPGLDPGHNRKRDAAPLTVAPEVRRAVAGWFADELDRCADLFGAHGAAWRARHAGQVER